MRYSSPLILLAIVLAMQFDGVPTAADETTSNNDVSVLLITGGHEFEEAPFFELFHSIPGVATRHAKYPAAGQLLTPDLADDCDVIVLYDMWTKPLPASQRQALLQLLDTGIGVVALHHTIAAHPTWPAYAEVIGGKYHLEDRTIDGEVLPASSYHHDQKIPVHIAAGSHPITRGLKDFVIHDETYADFDVDPQAQVLLTTEHPKNDRELCWTKTYGNSRVCYLQLGHDREAYENPDYRRLIARCVRWAAGHATDERAPVTNLFNGRDLDGWTATGNASWKVESGQLVGRQGPENAPGDLFTDAEYDDFELSVTYRVVWPANTGVWYRYQSPERAYQADILEYKTPVAYSGTLYCPGKMFLAINDDPKLVRRDGWNEMLVRVVQNRHVIVLNGTQVANVRDVSIPRGRIGFQIHAGNQFGDMQIIVKEIRLRQL